MIETQNKKASVQRSSPWFSIVNRPQCQAAGPFSSHLKECAALYYRDSVNVRMPAGNSAGHSPFRRSRSAPIRAPTAPTLNGVIVHAIMISRALYGLTAQGNLARALTHLNARTGTPLLVTAFGIGAILVLALAVPLSELADLTARFTLVVFAIINIALIRIKSSEAAAPLHVFVCPMWVPVAGLVSSIGLLLLDLVVR